MKQIANLSVRKRNPPPKVHMSESKRGTVDDDGLLGVRLRLRRKEMGLSQSALGQALGITFQQIQKYEKGANRVPASRLKQIAEFLQVPLTFFYDDTKAGAEVESLLSMDGSFSLRMLRAYSKLEPTVAHALVNLAESITRARVAESITRGR